MDRAFGAINALHVAGCLLVTRNGLMTSGLTLTAVALALCGGAVFVHSKQDSYYSRGWGAVLVVLGVLVPILFRDWQWTFIVLGIGLCAKPIWAVLIFLSEFGQGVRDERASVMADYYAGFPNGAKHRS